MEDLKLKDQAIERCKEFIQKQHEELERVNALLQKFMDRDNSLQSMSQLSGPTTQEAEEEDDEESTFSGNLSKGGALISDSQQYHRLLRRSTTLNSLAGTPQSKRLVSVDTTANGTAGEDDLAQLSQLSDVGGRRGLTDIMTFLKRKFVCVCVYLSNQLYF